MNAMGECDYGTAYRLIGSHQKFASCMVKFRRKQYS